MSSTNLKEEYESLRAGCGLAERAPEAVAAECLEMLGADRLRFLHAYVTCDIKALTAGQGTYGFFTSPQGRILADVVVTAHADRLWLTLPAGTLDSIGAHLRKYILADRVEMRPLAGVTVFTLAGPGAASALVHTGWPAADVPREAWSHARGTFDGMEVIVQRRERLGVPGFTVWVPATDPAAADAWRERLLAAGAVRLHGGPLDGALETVRVEAGVPRYGLDFGAQNFPQETGAEEAVSYTKGCYLGQEVVARIHYRGGVQKGLCGLLLAPEGGEPTTMPGAALSYEGREAGTVGSAVHSTVLDRRIGLAILHRRAAAVGTRLEVANGGSAEVCALPFVASASTAPVEPGAPGATEDIAAAEQAAREIRP